MSCEEVISNLKLPMILSYLGGEILAQRRSEYETTREDVPRIATIAFDQNPGDESKIRAIASMDLG